MREVTYPAYDIIVIRQMRLTALTTVDLITIKISIVGKTHFGGR